MINEKLEELINAIKEFDKTSLEKETTKRFLELVKEEFNRYEVNLIYENEYGTLTKDGLFLIDITPKITYELRKFIGVHFVDIKINKIPDDKAGFSINIPLPMFDTVKTALDFYWPEYLKKVKFDKLRITDNWRHQITKKGLDPDETAYKLTHPIIKVTRIDDFIVSEINMLEGGENLHVTVKYGGQLTPDDF